MENSQPGDMNSFCGDDGTTMLPSPNTKPDSFTVEFSHLTSKTASPNSRITKSLSRKGSAGEKQMSSNEKDGINFVPNSPSPRAAHTVGASTPEKPILLTVGATNNPFNQQIHHQITITTPATTTAVAQSKLGGRRYSLKRSSSWTIDPRRMLFLFATLSSMGTILLIYLTLSMNNVGGGGDSNNRD